MKALAAIAHGLSRAYHWVGRLIYDPNPDQLDTLHPERGAPFGSAGGDDRGVL